MEEQAAESCPQLSIVERSNRITVGDDFGDLTMGEVFGWAPRLRDKYAVMRDGGRYYGLTPLDGGEWGDTLFGVTRPNSRPDGRRCVHWGQLAGTDRGFRESMWKMEAAFFDMSTPCSCRDDRDGWSHTRLRHDGTETVGLLLDLDAGTMTAYLNGRLLGVMATG